MFIFCVILFGTRVVATKKITWIGKMKDIRTRRVKNASFIEELVLVLRKDLKRRRKGVEK